MLRPRLLPALTASLAGVLVLGGCWTQDTTDATAPETQLTATDAPTDAPSAAPSAEVPAGEVETFEYEGVTVTSAPGQEPSITLAEDFGPADRLMVADITEGSGDAVEPGATLTVDYVGVGEQSEQVFDSSWQRGQPASFPLDGVIEGWKQGMVGMQPGGRRVLIIPGSLAYGPGGRPPVIGEDETLVFVVDLIEQTPAS